MGNLNSDQYAVHVATGSSADKIPRNQWGITPRRYLFSITTTGSFGSAVSNVMNLVYIPGGGDGVRIFVDETKIGCSIDPGGAAVLGLGVYTEINGSTIASNSSALAALTGSVLDQNIMFKSMVLSYGDGVGGLGDRTLYVSTAAGVYVTLIGSTLSSVFSMASGTTLKGWIVAG